jgi:hypothetical protein
VVAWTVGLIFSLAVTSVTGLSLVFGLFFIGHTIFMVIAAKARLLNIGERPAYAYMMIVPLANLAIALGLCFVPENASRRKMGIVSKTI